MLSREAWPYREKLAEWVVIRSDTKRRYKRSLWNSGVLFHRLTLLRCIPHNWPVISWLKVVYSRFFNSGSYLQTNISIHSNRITFQLILTSYTTSEEENIPYPWISVQTIRNINKGLHLLENITINCRTETKETHQEKAT